jgi:hypothetical protein
MRSRPIAAACLAAALAGCGGSGGSDGGGKQSWAEQADAICGETEKRIRAREPAKSSADLERLMGAVVEDLKAGRSELKELELPDDRRKRAEPFLHDVDRAIDFAETIRDAGRDHVKVWMVAYEKRVLGLDLQEDAQAAGLCRCAKEASTKAIDAVMMPGYAQDVAEFIAPIIATIGAAEKLATPGRGAAYWKAVSAATDPGGTGRDPEALAGTEEDFTGPLNEARFIVDGLLRHYDGTVEIPAKELREKERRTYAVIRAAPAKGYALLKATGPPGEALLPRVKAAVRKAVARAG